MNDNTTENKRDSNKKLNESAKELEKAKTRRKVLEHFIKHVDLKRTVKLASEEMLKNFYKKNPDLLEEWQISEEEKKYLIELNTYFIEYIKEWIIPIHGLEYFNIGNLKEDILFRLKKPTVIKSQLIENEIKTVKDYIKNINNKVFENSLSQFFSGKEINFAVKLEWEDLLEIIRAETIAKYLVFLENLKIRSFKQKKSTEEKSLEELFEDKTKLDEIDKKLLQKKYIKTKSDGKFSWIGNPLNATGNKLRLVALAKIMKRKYFKGKCDDKQLWNAITKYYNCTTSYQIFKDCLEGNTSKYLSEFIFV